MPSPLKSTHQRDQERRLFHFREFGLSEDVQLGYYNYARTRGPITPHAHEDCMEICYLEKGQQVYEVGGDLYQLKGGDIFVTFPGEEHSTAEAPEEKGRLYWLIVPLPNFRSSETTAPFLSVPRKTARRLSQDLLHMPHRCFHASRTLAARFGKLMKLTEHPGDYAQLRIESALRELLLDLIECAADPGKQRIHPGINKVIRHIQANLAEPWDNPSMAAVAGLSESHFKAMFKKVTGNSPADHLARLRVEQAKKLLHQTNNPVTDIAFACGFSSSQYFATVFKRYAGVTPSAYRSRAV